MGSQYTITDEGFNIDDSPSINTDDELGNRFSTNLGLVQSNTRIANSLEDLYKDEEELNLRVFIHNLILKKGIRGKHLVSALEKVYEPNFLNSYKKLVASYVKRDYLIGNVYDDLSPYGSCVPLKSVIKRSSAKLIVKCGECSACPFNVKNNCGAYGKTLVDSPSQVDYQKVASQIGIDGDPTAININAHYKKESESLKVPTIKKSGHTVFNSNHKKESQYNLKAETKKNDPTKLNWDQIKKASKSGDTKKILSFFIRKNIDAGTLDFKRMFQGCDVSDLRNHKTLLKKVAYKYLAEDSVLGEVIDFYELPLLNRRLPASIQDESQWYNLRAEEEAEKSLLFVRDGANKKKSSLDQGSMTWNSFRNRYSGSETKDVLDHFILARISSDSVNLDQMFSGSNLEEVNINIKASTKRALKKYKGFKKYFAKTYSEDTFKTHKKEANLEPDLPYSSSGQAGDVMKMVSSKTKLDLTSLQSEFNKVLKTNNLNSTMKFVAKYEIKPDDLSFLVKGSVKSFPEVKNLCFKLLSKLGVIKKSSKKVSSTRRESKVDFDSLTIDGSELENNNDSIEDIKLSSGVIL